MTISEEMESLCLNASVFAGKEPKVKNTPKESRKKDQGYKI